MRRLAVLSALLMLCHAAAEAVTMRGDGAGYCPSLLNDQAAANAGRDTASIQFDQEWILGFITALSINGDVDFLCGTSADPLLSAVEGS